MPRSYQHSALFRSPCENVVSERALGPLYAPYLITVWRHPIEVSIRKFDIVVCRSAWKASNE